MHKLVFLSLAAFAMVLISACSPAKQYYQPLTKRPMGTWEGSSGRWGGYTEKSLGNDRLKVTFETFNNPGSAFASYFVKVRAAEIALARGHRTFWLSDKGTRRWTQTSHFPGRIIPGYMDHRTYYVDHCTRHCKKGCRRHRDIVHEDYWVPERYVPPHTSVNQLSKAEVIMSTSRRIGSKQDAVQIIEDALSGRHGFGKPKLSAQTMQLIRRMH